MGFRGSRVQIPPSRLGKDRWSNELAPPVFYVSNMGLPFGFPFLPVGSPLSELPFLTHHSKQRIIVWLLITP
jgi:hypothetical protein